MQIISNVALISINETMIVQLLSFLIFLFVFTRIMIRPLRRIMWEREHHLEKVKKEIDESKQIIQYCHQELDNRMHAVRKEARVLTREMESEGSSEAEKAFESVRQEIAGIKESTAQEIRAQIEKAKKGLAAESEALAVMIMENILDRSVKP